MAVDLVGPRGEAVAAASLGELQHYVNARGFRLASGTYADAVALLSGYVNHPAAPSEVEAVADPSTPLGAALKAAFGRVVQVESYRSAGDDTATITAAFAAVTAGDTIRFDAGRTYNLTAPLSIVMSGKDDVTVDFNGATITSTGTGAIFALTGEYWTAATTLAADAPAGATSLLMAAPQALAAGDLVTIRSDGETFNPDRPDYYLKGEFVRVRSRAGTTLNLETPVRYGYSTTGHTVTIGRITPVRRLTIIEPRIVGAADDTKQQYGLYVSYFEDVTVLRPRVTSATWSGVVGSMGVNFKVLDGQVTDCGADGLGYGYRALSVDGVTFSSNFGARNRHSFDSDSVDETRPFPTRDVTMIGNHAEDDTSCGFSTHGGTDGATIAHNTTRFCGGGIILRGRANTVIHNRVLGSKSHGEHGQSYQHGIVIGDDAPWPFGLGLAGEDLVVEHNQIDIANPRWASDGESSYGIYSTAKLVRARIANNRLAGFSSHGIYGKGQGADDAEIRNNSIDCSAQTGTANGVLLQPDSAPAGNVFGKLRIAETNRIRGALAAPVKIVGNATGAIEDGQQLAGAFRPGWWYAPGGGQGSTIVLGAGNAFWVPIYIPHPVSVSNLGIEVTTGVAATTILLGIYSDVKDGYGGIPDALIASCVVSSATSGFKNDVAPVDLAPGLYWLAACALGGNPTVRLCSTPGQAVGSPSAVGLSSRAGFRITGIASALPATFTGTPDPQGGVPLPQLRIADAP